MFIAALLVLLLASPATATVQGDTHIGPYLVQVTADSIDAHDVLVVRAGGRSLFRIDNFLRLRLSGPVQDPRVSISPGTDISGDGIPDLVVFGWSGGAHCCFVAWVLSLGEEFRVLAEVTGGDVEPIFRQMDDDTALEVQVVDGAFAYWPRSFGGSPSVRVALDWAGDRLHPSVELTATLQPTAAEVISDADRIRTDPGWQTQMEPYDAVFSRALELLYSGHEDLAASFIDSAWGGTRSGEVQLVMEFGQRLERSIYHGRLENARREMHKLHSDRPNGR